MARNRMIRPELWSNEQFVELSPTARLLYIAMWNFSDDGGNHPASPKTLKMEVFPGDDITAAEIQTLVQEIIAHGLITPYQADDRQWWHITNWTNLQKIDRPNPTHPAPFGEQSANNRRADDEFSQRRERREIKEKREEREHTPAHEDEISNQKNPPPQPSTPVGQTPTEIYTAINAHFNTDDGLRELVTWKKQAGYSDRIHGPTTGEVTKFIAKYLDRLRATDPIQYFRDHFAAWLVRATEYNRPKKDAPPKYEPPPPHQRQQPRTNGSNATPTTIGDIAGKIITEIAT